MTKRKKTLIQVASDLRSLEPRFIDALQDLQQIGSNYEKLTSKLENLLTSQEMEELVGDGKRQELDEDDFADIPF